MITKQELSRCARNLGFNLGQAEKNYLHMLTLYAISRLFPQALVFKGGTSLMVCHNLDRFSEDLDFTATTSKDVEFFLEKISEFLKNQNIQTKITLEQTTPISKQYSIRYTGPLHTGTNQTTSKIEIDISFREKIYVKPLISRISHPYNDIPSFYLNSMDLTEILAEKIRAILTRDKARDLYDCEYLLSKKIRHNSQLIQNKLQYYGKTFSLNELEKAIERKRNIWNPELKNLVHIIPDFDAVKKTILESFSLQQ